MKYLLKLSGLNRRTQRLQSAKTHDTENIVTVCQEHRRTAQVVLQERIHHKELESGQHPIHLTLMPLPHPEATPPATPPPRCPQPIAEPGAEGSEHKRFLSQAGPLYWTAFALGSASASLRLSGSGRALFDSSNILILSSPLFPPEWGMQYILQSLPTSLTFAAPPTSNPSKSLAPLILSGY